MAPERKLHVPGAETGKEHASYKEGRHRATKEREAEGEQQKMNLARLQGVDLI